MSVNHLPTACPNRSRGGNIILEMALVLPLLLVVIAGIIDVAMLLWEKQVLTNATREGARAAAMARTDGTGRAERTQAQVKDIVAGYLNNFHLKGTNNAPLVTLNSGRYTLNEGTCNYTWDSGTPRQLTVELVNVPLQMMLLPNIQKFFGRSAWANPLKVSGRTTMAAEWITPPD